MEHRLDLAFRATLSNAQPYDEDEIRAGAMRVIEACKKKSELEQLREENQRLRECISELEREGVERKYWHNCYEPRADGRYEG
jgi:hypothetical protein